MGREEQLQWERDNARWAAGAAFLAGILTIASALYLQNKITTTPDDSVESIVLVHAHKGDFLLAAILQAIGTAMFAPALYYLFRATQFRREQLPRALRYLVLFAPVTAAITAIVRQIQIANVSDKVVAKLPLPLQTAKDLVSDKVGETPLVVVGGIATAAALGVAFMFVLISLNAMRAGLLSRFIGIMGVIVGVLSVLPILPVPIVQVFWMGALAALFLNKWPQGRGPAWDSGEAIPWPSAAEQRDALRGDEPTARARPTRGRQAEADIDDEPADDEPLHTREAARPRASPEHPRSKKRKRKRRG